MVLMFVCALASKYTTQKTLAEETSAQTNTKTYSHEQQNSDKICTVTKSLTERKFRQSVSNSAGKLRSEDIPACFSLDGNRLCISKQGSGMDGSLFVSKTFFFCRERERAVVISCVLVVRATGTSLFDGTDLASLEPYNIY